MTPRFQTLALLGLLVHFLIVNLVATFAPFQSIPMGFRNLTMLFSAVLLVDILFVVNEMRRENLDE